MSIYNTPMPNYPNEGSSGRRLMPGLVTTAAGGALGVISLFLPFVKIGGGYGYESSSISLIKTISEMDNPPSGAILSLIAVVAALGLSIAALVSGGKVGLAKAAGITCIVLGGLSLIGRGVDYNDVKDYGASDILGIGFHLLTLASLIILIGGIVTVVLTGKVKAQNNFGPSPMMGNEQFGPYGQQPGVPQGGYQDPGFQQQGYPQQGGYPQQWGGQQQPW